MKQKIGQHYVASAKFYKKTSSVAVSKKNPLLAAMVAEDNETLTENGALTFKSSLNGLVDFFAMGASLRTRDEGAINTLSAKLLLKISCWE